MAQEKLIIKKPFDAHVHVRRGAMLTAVVPYSAERFYSGIIMPNTEPPIETINDAALYKKEILAAVPKGMAFEPLMTLYLTRKLTRKHILAAAKEKTIFGVKYYPWGATTNSQWGYRNILDAKEVLRALEETGIPLLLHAEVHLNQKNEEEDPYDGEKIFIQEVLPRLLRAYPALRISLEHLSSGEAIDFIAKHGKEKRLVATVTPHHLTYDRTQAFSGGYKALLHCKPLVKTKKDREKLRALVKKGLPFVYAGTDTAPHPEGKKFGPSCAFGVFNAPVAVEMYAQVFDELSALKKLEGFLSIYGPEFYGLTPSSEKITLIKKPWQVEEPVVTADGTKIWPVAHKEHGLGGEILQWQIKGQARLVAVR